MRPRIAIVALLGSGLGLSGLGRAESMDLSTVVAAWRQSSDRLRALPAYVLEGQCRVRSFVGGRLVGTTALRWRSLVDGKRYRVAWHPDKDSTHEQSFDGAVWYGLTDTPNVRAGIVCAQPQVSAEADLDEQLRKQSAGIFFPTLADVVERPLNFDSKSLLDGYETSGKGVFVSDAGDKVVLALTPELAQARQLPDKLVLAMIGDALYPQGGTMLPAPGGNVSQEMRFSSYRTLGRASYPAKIVGTVWQGSGARRELIMEETIDLAAKLQGTVAADDFRIAFPPGARIMDDRKTGPARVARVPTPRAPGRAWAVPGALVAVVALGAGALFVRRRK